MSFGNDIANEVARKAGRRIVFLFVVCIAVGGVIGWVAAGVMMDWFVAR
jgi:cell division protein FtsX